MKILITRTDNIGDLVLTLPLAQLLKEDNPEHEVWFLVRDYAAPVLQAAEFVDGWLSWDHLSSISIEQAVAEIKAEKFDVSLHVHPHRPASRLMWKAKIPLRAATRRRWYHFLHCNRWMNLSRHASHTHEGLLNTEIFKPIFPQCVRDSLDNFPLPSLQVTKRYEKVESILDPARKTIILHPGSNGHGREWALSRWEKLAGKLDPTSYQVLITGSPGEAERFVGANWPDGAQNIMGQVTLEEMIALIARSYALVAGSTGPVHLAGALGIHALALQSSGPTRGPWRWRPLGKKAEYLSIIPRCDGTCTQESCPCIEAIEVHHVLSRIHKWE